MEQSSPFTRLHCIVCNDLSTKQPVCRPSLDSAPACPRPISLPHGHAVLAEQLQASFSAVNFCIGMLWSVNIKNLRDPFVWCQYACCCSFLAPPLLLGAQGSLAPVSMTLHVLCWITDVVPNAKYWPTRNSDWHCGSRNATVGPVTSSFTWLLLTCRRAMREHPDKHSGKPACEKQRIQERFKLLSAAYSEIAKPFQEQEP